MRVTSGLEGDSCSAFGPMYIHQIRHIRCIHFHVINLRNMNKKLIMSYISKYVKIMHDIENKQTLILSEIYMLYVECVHKA